MHQHVGVEHEQFGRALVATGAAAGRGFGRLVGGGHPVDGLGGDGRALAGVFLGHWRSFARTGAGRAAFGLCTASFGQRLALQRGHRFSRFLTRLGLSGFAERLEFSRV